MKTQLYAGKPDESSTTTERSLMMGNYRLTYYEPYQHVSLERTCSVMLKKAELVFEETNDDEAEKRLKDFLGKKVKVLGKYHKRHPREFVKVLKKW